MRAAMTLENDSANFHLHHVVAEAVGLETVVTAVVVPAVDIPAEAQYGLGVALDDTTDSLISGAVATA